MSKKIVHNLINKPFLERVFWYMISLVLFSPVFAGAATIDNPLRADNLVQLLRDIIDRVILPFGIPIAAVFIIYSGFLFITARGNQEQLTRAKRNFWWVIVGTAILLGVYVIIVVIQGTISSLGPDAS